MVPENGSPVANATSSRVSTDPQNLAPDAPKENPNFINELKDAARQNSGNSHALKHATSNPVYHGGRTAAVPGELEIPTASSILNSDQVRGSPQNSDDQCLPGEVHLPLPSPSENCAHVSHDRTVGHPIRSLPQPDDSTATRLEQLMATYGSVDEIEKHLRMSENPERPSTQTFLSQGASMPTTSSAQYVGSTTTGSPPVRTSLSSHPTNAAASNSIAQKRVRQTAEQARKRVYAPVQPLPDQLTWLSLNTAFSTHQHGEPSTFDSLMKGCAEVVSDRLETVSKLGERGPIEYARLELLRDACTRCDYSYLLLHQLYCRNADKSIHKGAECLNRLQKQGLSTLEIPLASNDRLPQDAISWFANFPGSLATIFTSTWYENALQTLAHLTLHWNDLQIACSRREFPPLVSEMLTLLQVQSVKLQEVIFRVMLRDIMKSADQCFQKHEEIFIRNQQFCIDQSSRSQDFTSHDIHFANEHREVWVSHLLHTQSRSRQSSSSSAPVITPNMGPPVSMRIDSGGHSAMNGPWQGLSPRVRQGSNGSPFVGSPSPQLSSHGQSIPISRHNNVRTSRQSSTNQVSPAPIAQQRQSESMSQSSPPSLGPPTFTMQANPIGPDPGRPHSAHVSPNGQSGATSGRSPEIGMNTHRHHLRQSPTQSFLAPTAVSPPGCHSANMTFGTQASMFAQSHHVQSSHSNQLASMGNQQQSTMQMSRPDQFIRFPATRSQYALPEPPTPLTTALHHAGTSSPTISTQAVEKCFGCMQRVFMCPEAMSHKVRYQQHTVPMSPEDISALAKDTYSASGVAKSRIMCPNSYTYRIKCVKSKLGSEIPSTEEWAVSNHSWPLYIAILLNDQALDIRRQSHYGKDLPIDVTRIIKEGHNILTIAIMDPSPASNNNEQYLVGLEAIQTLSYSQTKFLIASLDMPTAQHRILSRARAATNDPDLEILQPELVIDLTDPFTANIFVVPVRGKDCTHIQCFDLDTFLSTRSGGVTKDKPEQPCSPDEFRCPICKGDVRPGSLVIDPFLESIRQKLQAIDRLDAKAVKMGVNGDWVIKEEEEGKGRSGDGEGEGPRPQDEGALGSGRLNRRSNAQSNGPLSTFVNGVTAAGHCGSSAQTVITLDEDD